MALPGCSLLACQVLASTLLALATGDIVTAASGGLDEGRAEDWAVGNPLKIGEGVGEIRFIVGTTVPLVDTRLLVAGTLFNFLPIFAS